MKFGLTQRVMNIAALKVRAPTQFPAGSSVTLEVLNRYNTEYSSERSPRARRRQA